MGDPTCAATAAAILNGIHDAVGVRITSLPATAEKVLAAIKANQAQETRQLTV
jgi:nicotinate dehydrogenase medium molybdopterin subunit